MELLELVPEYGIEYLGLHSLDDAPMYVDPIFGFQVPEEVVGVPKEILNPRLTWRDPGDYDEQALKLARLFETNFEQYRDHCPASVIGAGPQAG